MIHLSTIPLMIVVAVVLVLIGLSVYCVYSPVEFTEFSALVHPISRAALNATPSARIVELAKPSKHRRAKLVRLFFPLMTI